MTLAKKTFIGVIWNFSDQLARRGVGMLVTILLANFLLPEDFGLIAMMAVFLALGQSLMDSGFSQALIRMKEVSRVAYSTAFYANITLGLTSYVILYCASPFISSFYEEPRLIDLIRVGSMAVIINSFQVIQTASLTRELNFKAQIKASFPASIISGFIAVYLAYIDYGVWALVSQILLSALLHTVLLWITQGWRPIYAFDYVILKSMYKFGCKIFISGVLDTIFKNIYVVLIAKFLEVSVAGLYFVAEKIKDLVLSQLVRSIQTVTYPSLSKMQDDTDKLKSGYKKVLLITTYLLFPALLFLAALAYPLFYILLPGEWILAVPYLQLMCIGSLLYPLHAMNLNILKVKGRSDLFLYLEIAKKILTVFIVYISIDYGIYGLLIGQIINSVLAYVPNCFFSSRLIGYPALEQISDFLPAMILSIVVSFFGFMCVEYFRSYFSFYLIFILGGGMLLLYIFLTFLFRLKAGVLVVEFINDLGFLRWFNK